MAEDSGGGVRGTFTKKLGPLPAWAWILAGAGVGFLYLRYRASKSTAGVGSTASPSDLVYGAAPGSGGLLGTGLGAGGFVDNSGGSSSSGTGTGTTTPPVVTPPIVVQPAPPPPAPPPQGTSGPPSGLVQVDLGGQLLNWTQDSLNKFMVDIANVPHFPWAFAGQRNGVWTFTPVNTVQPLPPGSTGNRVPLDIVPRGGSSTQASVAGNLTPQAGGVPWPRYPT